MIINNVRGGFALDLVSSFSANPQLCCLVFLSLTKCVLGSRHSNSSGASSALLFEIETSPYLNNDFIDPSSPCCREILSLFREDKFQQQLLLNSGLRPGCFSHLQLMTPFGLLWVTAANTSSAACQSNSGLPSAYHLICMCIF